jgi:hypothetical protein
LFPLSQCTRHWYTSSFTCLFLQWTQTCFDCWQSSNVYHLQGARRTRTLHTFTSISSFKTTSTAGKAPMSTTSRARRTRTLHTFTSVSSNVLRLLAKLQCLPPRRLKDTYSSYINNGQLFKTYFDCWQNSNVYHLQGARRTRTLHTLTMVSFLSNLLRLLAKLNVYHLQGARRTRLHTFTRRTHTLHTFTRRTCTLHTLTTVSSFKRTSTAGKAHLHRSVQTCFNCWQSPDIYHLQVAC